MAGLNLLIIGKPGVSKTTLAECIVRELRGSSRVAAFTTTEVRDRAGASDSTSSPSTGSRVSLRASQD